MCEETKYKLLEKDNTELFIKLLNAYFVVGFELSYRR